MRLLKGQGEPMSESAAEAAGSRILQERIERPEDDLSFLASPAQGSDAVGRHEATRSDGSTTATDRNRLQLTKNKRSRASHADTCYDGSPATSVNQSCGGEMATWRMRPRTFANHSSLSLPVQLGRSGFAKLLPLQFRCKLFR